jgi:predicted DNA-binding protein (MmcQ/YjbR family)
MMDIDWIRETCLEFPHATEQIQWGNDLLFKVGGKMFAVAPLVPAPVCLSFKCSEEMFAELTERPQVIPAPYLARAKWVALEAPEAVSRVELAGLLRASYDLVFARLPKRARQELSSPSLGKNKPRKKAMTKGKKPAGGGRTRN